MRLEMMPPMGAIYASARVAFSLKPRDVAREPGLRMIPFASMLCT